MHVKLMPFVDRNYQIQAFRQTRSDLPTDLAKTASCCIVGSRLDYCNSLLYEISAKNLQKLQRIQNNLARITLMAPRLSSAEPLLKSLHWLPVTQRIKYKIATITQSANDRYLSPLLQHRTSLRTTRSDNLELLAVPDFHLELSCRAFLFAALTVRNTLIELRKTLSSTAFKTN